MLLIDDEDFPYLEMLQAHDFHIRQVRDVNSLGDVKDYDVVLCDIRGVGKAFGSRFEGAHLISQIRDRYPEKIIVAYTGQQFDATYNEHLRRSDFVLKKDADTTQWVETLTSAVHKVLDPAQQWRRVREFLYEHNVSSFDVALIEDEYVCHLEGNRREFPSERILHRVPEDVRNVLTSLVASALFQLMTSV